MFHAYAVVFIPPVHWCYSFGARKTFCMQRFRFGGTKFHVLVDTQNWNFYWDLIKMWNINASQGRIPCAIVTKFAECVPRFRMHFHWICSRGYGVMGVLSWRGLVAPKSSAPDSGETMRQTPNVLEVQERAWGPLSPCKVCCGSDFTRRRGGQKRCTFCLSVGLFATLIWTLLVYARWCQLFDVNFNIYFH